MTRTSAPPDSKAVRTGVVYARVAMDPPDSFPLKRQVAACTQIAELHGIAVAGTYADSGGSGLRQDRPQYRQMLDDLRALRPDALVTWNLDRLSRSPSGLAELADVLQITGTKLYTADGPGDVLSPVDPFVLRLQARFREQESVQASERAKRARSRHKGSASA